MSTITLATQKLAQLEQDVFATYTDHASSSFMCGNGALPLLYYKLYTLHQDNAYRQKAEAVLNSLMDQVNTGLTTFTYCDGLAGVAAMLNYLVEKDLVDDSVEEFLEQCDTTLYQAFVRMAAKANFDYLHGAMGLAFYFLHRRLASTTVTGTLALVGEEVLAQSARTLHPSPGGYVNCGLAHGQLSIIMFLAKYLPVAEHPVRVASVLRALVQQVLRYRSSDPTSMSLFPAIVHLKEASYEAAYTTPNGWCYGDTMVSLTLWAAGQALNDEALQAEATAIALLTTHRDTPAAALIVDGAICHGSAGLAHLYKKWHQATGHPQFRASYEYWISQTLAMANRPDGPGGFQKNLGRGTHANAYGLLDGACGIGMVLADFIADSPDEPSDWDRFFALS